MRTWKCCIVVFALCKSVSAQDFHHTHIYNSYSLQSPSYVGALSFHRFLYKNRVLVAHRQQWRSINSEFVSKKTPFVSNYASYDAIFRIPELTYLDFFSLGIEAFRESAGDLNLSSTLGSVSFSYHKSLNRTSTTFLSLATKFGMGQKSIDFGNSFFDSQWNGRDFDPNRPNGERFVSDRFFYPDLSFGVLYTHFRWDFISYRLGSSLSHVNQPLQSGFLSNSVPERLYMRYDFMGGLRIPMYEWTLRPDFIFSSLGPAKEFSITSMLEIPSSDPIIINSLGIGARVVGSYRIPALNDALTFHYQLYYRDFDFTFSYDLNLSSLKYATSTYGAFETSLIYYFGRSEPVKSLPKRYKRGSTDCPKHQKGKQGWVN